MSYLSDALKKYYKKQNGRIVFINNQTLNQLSLQMWEDLSFSQIDASVTSRVISGERLFTQQQLEVFCKILKLSNQETEILFNCLNRDLCKRHNIDLDLFYISNNDFIAKILHLSEECTTANYKGNLIDVIKICEKIEIFSDYLMQTALPTDFKKNLHKIIAMNLYMKMKSQAAFFVPKEALPNMLEVTNKLFNLSKLYDDKLMWCYGNILLAYAYCIEGQAGTRQSRSFYIQSIRYAKQTLPHLELDDNARIFALHVIAVSASYNHDKETLSYLFKEFDKILPRQPKANDISIHFFAGALMVGSALLKYSNPFSYKERSLQYFGEYILEDNVYKMSSIKREIEVYRELGSYDNKTLINLAKQGLTIATKHNYKRHKKYLENVITAF